MAFSTGTLEERHAQLSALLNDSAFSGDTDALIAEVDEVITGIDAQNERRARQDEARARLTTSAVRPAVDAVVPTATTNSGQESAENRNGLRSIDIRTAAHQFADHAKGYESGKRSMSFDSSNGQRLDLLSLALSQRSVITTGPTNGDGGAGAFTPLAPQAEILKQYEDRPLRLADMIDRRPTDMPIIEYVQDTTAKGGGSAAEVAEAGVKPETTYTFTLVSDTVKTVAHWVNITRATVADHAQLQSYVQGRLIYGLGFRLDNEILNGDGTGTNLKGIVNTSGINLYAPGAATDPYTEPRVISIRRSMTPVYDKEYAPTAVALYPDDWELVELSTDDRGMFRVSPNVQDAMNPRIWGMNVAVTTAVAPGTSVTGDFKMGATLWDRQEATIYITDSHASNFTSNILTLLAEIRVGLSIHRLGAFTLTTFNGDN